MAARRSALRWRRSPAFATKTCLTRAMSSCTTGVHFATLISIIHNCSSLNAIFIFMYQNIHSSTVSPAFPHFRFQLVYAYGSSVALPAISERAIAMQALLLKVSEHVDSPANTLKQDKSAIWVMKQNRCVPSTLQRGLLKPQVSEMHACIRNSFAIRIVFHLTPFRKPGSFCGLRLLPGEALEVAIPKLVKRLAKDLVDNPPYDMRWLLGLVKNQCLIDSPTRCLLGLKKKQKVENEVRGQFS